MSQTKSILDRIPRFSTTLRQQRPLTKRYFIAIMCFLAVVGTLLFLIYGQTLQIGGVAWLPLLNILLVGAVALFLYGVFHNIQMTERSNLWVGLAKETAHQLGTPISSLMGWVEYIRAVRDPEAGIEPQEFIDQVQKICDDMENDLTRLRKITNRFSQIGSVPALASHDLNVILEESMSYFRMRSPLLGKRIEISAQLATLPPVSVNRDLIEWVFENLFKNSIDALVKEDGFIEVRTEYSLKEKLVRVHHFDNGRGIPWEDQPRLFLPGFTTKKRGWGLGLTLAKRIVEDYHSGKIYLHWSQKNLGSVFCIELPVRQGG